jgi:hypothetical protein
MWGGTFYMDNRSLFFRIEGDNRSFEIDYLGGTPEDAFSDMQNHEYCSSLIRSVSLDTVPLLLKSV